MEVSPPPSFGEPDSAPKGGAGVIAEMAAGLGHDFNNILTAMSGNIILAERHAAGNQKLIRLLKNMRLATERAAVLAQQLQALAPGSKVAPGGLTPGINEVLPDLRPPNAKYPLPQLPTANSRVLIVEDDIHIAELAQTVLEELGHKVDLRHDAPAALALLREGGKTYDLVFSDIVMPGGMSGIQLAERIAVTFPGLPVLLATGYSTAALAPGALRFPVLAKPYSVTELTRRVEEMLPLRSVLSE